MLTFREFFELISERIGAHLLPVQVEAHDIGAFVAADGVHHPLDRRLAQCIYRANRCGHLDAAICPDTTFRALGRFLKELRGMPDTDVDQVALVESVGEHLSELWQERSGFAGASPPPEHHAPGSAAGRFPVLQKLRNL